MPSTARRIVLPKPEQYLGAENDGECRHEFVRGAIHAMADGRDSHGLIAGNIAANLKSALPTNSFRLSRNTYSPGRVSGASRSTAGAPTGNARFSHLKLRSCWSPSATL